MTSILRAELQQRKPFNSLEQEATLNIARTEAALREPLEELLKGAGVSLTQYNVLRILRGAGPEGLIVTSAAPGICGCQRTRHSLTDMR